MAGILEELELEIIESQLEQHHAETGVRLEVSQGCMSEFKRVSASLENHRITYSEFAWYMNLIRKRVGLPAKYYHKNASKNGVAWQEQ